MVADTYVVLEKDLSSDELAKIKTLKFKGFVLAKYARKILSARSNWLQKLLDFWADKVLVNMALKDIMMIF